MSSEITVPDHVKYAIEVCGLSKCYQIYSKPSDRLKQMLWRGRRKYYQEFWALKDVSFKIKKGETVGVIGRNGSGKSTLLQMICGTLHPTDGEVKVHGRVAALLELGAGFNPEFSGVENVYMAASLYGLGKDEVDQRFDAIAAFADIGEHIHQPVKTYSSGMFARLAFSVAVHVEPDILVVDEALSVGDARFVAKSMKRIKRLQDSGATILFVSHDVGSVRALCEQAIWLHAGNLFDLGAVFPVTGRFTEYLFENGASDDVPKSGEDATEVTSFANADNAPSSKAFDVHGREVEDHAKEANISEKSGHLAHWGSHQGLILSADLFDANEQAREVFNFDDRLVVRVSLKIPAELIRAGLGVAISIKDLKGVDLIVSSTYDGAAGVLPNDERFSVVFSMENTLVDGDYLLVVAVERREQATIHYYEYIEGVKYFKILADRKMFGVFQPKISQSVLV